MARTLTVEIVGDDASLQRAAASAAAALHEVRLGATQASESRATASQILEGVRGISEASMLAAHELDSVRLTATMAAESAAAGDAIKANIHSIGDAAGFAAAKIGLLKAALVAHVGRFGGGGDGGGGGLLAAMGWGGGMFGLAKFGSLLALAGLGGEHAALTGVGLGGSIVGGLLGGGLLGLGALGTTAVGMGTDMAGIGQAANDIKTITPLVGNLNAAIQQYGKNSAQAAAAQQALNQGLDGFSSKARAAVLAAAQTANQFHAMFNAATGAAESVGAKIINEAMMVGEKFLPTIGKFALQNMDIIKRDIQPLFDWLQNGAFKGPGRGGGLGIFTDLERIFQGNLPASIHAFSQGFELLMKVTDVAAQHLGGFLKTINDVLTKLNGSDFGNVSRVVNTLIRLFGDLMHLVGALGRGLVDMFKPAAGVGDAIIRTFTQLLRITDQWLGQKGTQNVLSNLFSVHLQQVIGGVFGVLKAGWPILEQIVSAFLQVSTAVSSLTTGPLKLVADLIKMITEIPFASKIIGWGVAIGVLVTALNSVLMAADPVYLAIVAVALAAGLIYTHWGAISGFFRGLWSGIKHLFDEGIHFVEDHWRAFAIALATIVAGPLGALVAFVATHWSEIAADAVHAWDVIKSDAERAWNAVRNAVVTAWDWIAHAVSSGIRKVIAFVRALPGEFIAALGDLGHLLWNAGVAIIDGLWNGLKSEFEKVKGWLSHVGGWIKNLKGPLEKDLLLLQPEGAAIIHGLMLGMQSQMPTLLRFTSSIAPALGSSVGVRPASGALASSSGGPTHVVVNVTVPNGFIGDNRDLVDRLSSAFVRAANSGHPLWKPLVKSATT